MHSDETCPPLGSPLDSAEREACLEQAARAIRERFERDQKVSTDMEDVD